MPDQSSAATEHAILQEITVPLETLPDDPVAAVQADFPSALRGYDRTAVDAYVAQTSRLVAELQATRSPEAAVRRALERVGEQISGVLQRAHETAEQITTQSRSEAEERLEQSRLEAAEIAAAAQQKVNDLDADTDRIWSERNRIVEDARDLASQLLTLADTAAEQFPAVAETEGHRDAGTTAWTSVPSDDAEDRYEVDADRETQRESDLPPAELRSKPAPEDVERTVAFQPIESGSEFESESKAEAEAQAVSERTDPASEAPTRDLRRSSSVIPPASQAATRRASR